MRVMMVMMMTVRMSVDDLLSHDFDRVLFSYVLKAILHSKIVCNFTQESLSQTCLKLHNPPLYF